MQTLKYWVILWRVNFAWPVLNLFSQNFWLVCCRGFRVWHSSCLYHFYPVLQLLLSYEDPYVPYLIGWILVRYLADWFKSIILIFFNISTNMVKSSLSTIYRPTIINFLLWSHVWIMIWIVSWFTNRDPFETAFLKAILTAWNLF